MRRAEDIRKGLECCRAHHEGSYCAECPYRAEEDCENELRNDGIRYIDRTQSLIGALIKMAAEGAVGYDEARREECKKPLSIYGADMLGAKQKRK